MINVLVSVIACFVFILGVVALISPIPIGVFLMGASVATLVCVSPRARSILTRLRIAYRWVDHKFQWLENKIQHRYPRLAQKFKQTRPGQEQEQDSD